MNRFISTSWHPSIKLHVRWNEAENAKSVFYSWALKSELCNSSLRRACFVLPFIFSRTQRAKQFWPHVQRTIIYYSALYVSKIRVMHTMRHLVCILMTVAIVSSTHRTAHNTVILSESTEQQTPICFRTFSFFPLWCLWDGERSDHLLAAWQGFDSLNQHDFWLSHDFRKCRGSPTEFGWFFFSNDGPNWAFSSCWPITAKQ